MLINKNQYTYIFQKIMLFTVTFILSVSLFI